MFIMIFVCFHVFRVSFLHVFFISPELYFFRFSVFHVFYFKSVLPIFAYSPNFLSLFFCNV